MTDRRSTATPREMLGVAFTLLLALVPLAISGCPASPPPAAINAESDGYQPAKTELSPQVLPPSIARAAPAGLAKVALPIPETPPEPLHKPEVFLSHAHAQTCLVGVGDPLPPIALPDLEGNVRALPDLYGEKLTVVVFWSDRKIFAREQFARLGIDTDQFRDFGVSVVAINVGDPPEVVAQQRRAHAGGCECLIDEPGQALARVATGKLPRTYLLDAEGRIVWFDIEFSRATERELRNALYWHLLPEGQRYLPDTDVVPVSSPAAAGISG
jgi:peroxiredoxin